MLICGIHLSVFSQQPMTNGGCGGDVRGGIRIIKKENWCGAWPDGGSKEKPKRSLVTAPETDKLSKRNGVWVCFVGGRDPLTLQDCA